MARTKSITVIQDPLLEPFYINADRECFTVLERTFSDTNHRLSKGESKENFKVIGYYSSFDECLNKIATQKLQLGQEFNSVNEFLEEFNKIKEQIKEYTNAVRSNI